MTGGSVAACFASARYELAGRGPRFDCWGLVLAVIQRLGLPAPLDPGEGAASFEDMLNIVKRSYRAADWQRVDLRPDTIEASAGAVVFFPCQAQALHVGVVVDGGILDIERKGGRVRFRSLADIAFMKWECARWAS